MMVSLTYLRLAHDSGAERMYALAPLQPEVRAYVCLLRELTRNSGPYTHLSISRAWCILRIKLDVTTRLHLVGAHVNIRSIDHNTYIERVGRVFHLRWFLSCYSVIHE